VLSVGLLTADSSPSEETEMLDEHKSREQLIAELHALRQRLAEVEKCEMERRRAEEALRESEERWQFALEGPGDGVWDWNVQTNEVFFSRQWKAMLGYEDHEIGNTLDEWDKRVHPADKEQCYTDLHRHFKGETPVYQNVHRVLCKDGAYKWVLDRGKVTQWLEEGKPLRVIGTHADITERKSAEEALRESQATLQGFYDSSPLMMGVSELDGDRVIGISGNAAIAGFLGTTPEEIPNRTGEDLCKSAEVDRLWVEQYRRCLSEGGPVRFQFDPIVWPRWLEATISFIGEGSSGRPRFSFIVEDITERKQSLEALKESLTRLDSIIDFLPDATFVIDKNGQVIAWNKAIQQMTGISKTEMIYKGNYEYSLPFYGERCPSLIDMVRSPTHHETAHYHISRDGDRIYGEVHAPQTYEGKGAHLWCTASLLRDSNGNIVGAIESIRDVTERKQIEDKLKRSRDELELRVYKRTKTLEDANAALRFLLKQREEDKQEFREAILANVRHSIQPYLDKLSVYQVSEEAATYLKIVASKINDIASSFILNISDDFLALTPMEIRVAEMIRDGRNTKEIGALLHLSPGTIRFHRENLREKLGIKGKSTNLVSFLKNLKQ
jgi:PAS domain S-box-containing protein